MIDNNIVCKKGRRGFEAFYVVDDSEKDMQEQEDGSGENLNDIIIDDEIYRNMGRGGGGGGENFGYEASRERI